MKFLIDNQLPPLLARELTRAGFDAVHVIDLKLEKAPDSRLWAAARESGRILVSMDEDFHHLSMRPGETVRLVWIRMGNTRRALLLEKLLPLWPELVNRLERGERLLEVR